MRINEGRKTFYWLAGAALLLASTQPVLAKCPADSSKDLTIDKTDFETHVHEQAVFRLTKPLIGCKLKMTPTMTAPGWDSSYTDLKFDCSPMGSYRGRKHEAATELKRMVAEAAFPVGSGAYYCVSTRPLPLHQTNGVYELHWVVLFPFFHESGGKRYRDVNIQFADHGWTRHAGVAHGTGDE